MVRSLATFTDPARLAEYINYYKKYASNAASYWANKDRPDYESEWWMHINRNGISKRQLGMIPSLKTKKVLGIGASYIAEEALIEDMQLDIVKIDICGEIGGKGVIECDACDMPFEDKSFDVIICREVIEHVLDDRALMNEIKRVLKPKGWLHLTTPNAYNVLPDGKEHLRGYTPIGLLEVMNKFGFTVIAKEGNVPNVFHALIPMAMAGENVDKLLNEFKYIAKIMEGQEWSYYIGSLMMVLCANNADTA